MTGQSRRHSALEAVLNVLIGYGVVLSMTSFCLILDKPWRWLCRRSYAVRRMFNWMRIRPGGTADA